MFKFGPSFILTFVLYTPLSAQAYHDWSIYSKDILKPRISFQNISPPALSINWPYSDREAENAKQTFSQSHNENKTATLETQSFMDTFDSEWIFLPLSTYKTTAFLNYTNNSYDNSDAWFVKAYLGSPRKTTWLETFKTPYADRLTLSDNIDSQTETYNPVPTALSWVLLIFALVGWRAGRRLHKQQTLFDLSLSDPANQQFARESTDHFSACLRKR